MAKKRSGTALAPRKQEQAAAVASMNPKLLKVSNRINKQLGELRDRGVITFYEIGKLVAQVCDDGSTYGEHAIEKLAANLPMKQGANTLRYARVFTDTFSVEEVKEASLEAEKYGNEVTQSHWVALSQHAGRRAAKVREAVLKLIVRQGYTVRETEQELHRREGRTTGNAPQGRKPSAPKTPLAGLLQMSRYQRDIGIRVPVWGPSVFDQLDSLTGEKVTDDMILQAETTQADLLDTAKACTELAKRCGSTAGNMKKAKKGGSKSSTAQKPGKMQKPTKKKASVKRDKAKATAKRVAAATKKKAAKKKVAKKKVSRVAPA